MVNRALLHFSEGEGLVDHAGYMREALAEAEKAYALGEAPARRRCCGV